MEIFKSRRWACKAIVLVTLAPLAHTATAQISMASAINRAARFRALSQRCAKAYCQVYLDVLPDNAREVLINAQRLVQVGVEDLTRANLTGEMLKQLNAVQRESSVLGSLLASSPTRDSVAAASVQADKMLTEANRLTEALQATAKQPSAKLIAISGRQRMLSQRMAKNYFLASAGADTKTLREQIASDRAEFQEAMSTLNAASVSTSAIRNELQLAQSQWLFMDTALTHKPDPAAMRNVGTTSERLLDVCNNLTTHYEVALKDLLGST
jgi:hypothetical protein